MRNLMVGSLLLAVLPSLNAQEVTVTVHGKQSVYFSGQDPVFLAELADFLGDPANDLPGLPDSPAVLREHLIRDLRDPEIVPDAIDVSNLGPILDISAVGSWGHQSNILTGPDGRPGQAERTQAAYGVFGVSVLEADLNMLTGVFLPEAGPSMPAPASLSVTSGDSMRTPQLGQAFAIGRNLENITVPDSATQLFLGLHDGTEWINNAGTVNASIFARPVLNLGSLQQVFDEFTVGPVANQSSVDVFRDFIDDQQDSAWTTTGGALATFRLVAELGDAEASFGIYDPTDPSRRVQIFGGADSAGAKAAVANNADGSIDVIRFGESGVTSNSDDLMFVGNRFGYYLDSPRNGLFFSDTELNEDEFDHQLAYQGTDGDVIQLPGGAPGLWTNSEYLLAWEDLSGGGDRDYQDFVVAGGGIQHGAIPEPASIVCWGLLIVFANAAFWVKKSRRIPAVG